MALASVERTDSPPPDAAAEWFDEACRQSAHIAHEAGVFKTRAEDAIEDGVHAVKRAAKSAQRRVEAAGDLKDEALQRVKRHPVLAVGIAFGIGCGLGVVVGVIAGHAAKEDWKP